MKFWKGNRLDGEFEAEPADVARQFDAWFRQQPAHYRVNVRLDRALRSWLTRSDGFNSVWDEGPDYEELFSAVYDLVFGVRKDPVTLQEKAAFLATAKPTRRGRP